MSTSLEHIRSLRDALAKTQITLATEHSVQGAQALTRALRIIDDHVLPRLSDLDAPLLAVIGGSTGSGKSTLLNTLVRADLSASSVVRPTTRHPVLVHRPEDEDWFMTSTILPSLARVSRDGAPAVHSPGEAAHLELRSTREIPEHMALLDAPDVDSVVEENRDLARQLLDAADLWIFVTTAARYADAVPWSVLAPAAQRGVLVAIVLNRVPQGSTSVICEDLRRLMRAQGLGDAPLFAIEEHPLTNKRLDLEDIAQLEQWLREQSESQETRLMVAEQAVSASVGQVCASVREVLAALDVQRQILDEGSAALVRAQAHALARLKVATADGSLLRAEVMTRWQDIVGAADLTRSINRMVSFLRDRVTSALTGKPTSVQPVEDALEAGLTTLIEDELEAMRDEAEHMWRQDASLKGVLSRIRQRVAVRDCAVRASQEWQADLLGVIREVGASKRQSARLMAVGVNVVAAALMIVIFASTGGLTGMELGVAGASTAVSHKLLEAIFGDQAVRSMTKTAQQLLSQRLQHAADEVLAPMRHALDEVTPSSDDNDELSLEQILARVEA